MILGRHMCKEYAFVEKLAGDSKLVLRFLAVFSRFEYALKRAGYLKKSENAEPNWDTFANKLKGDFKRVQETSFKEAVKYLLQNPPKTQIVSGKQLDWTNNKQGDGESKERYILRLIQTIRNNLFHGGKYPTGPMYDTARDQNLLTNALIVLKQCLELGNDVREFFAETP